MRHIGLPIGACLHRVGAPKVTLTIPWADALGAIRYEDGPKKGEPTTPAHWDIYNFGSLYTPRNKVIPAQTIFLVSLPRKNAKDLRTLEIRNGLEEADPRQCLALAESNPDLHKALGLEMLAIVFQDYFPLDGHRRLRGCVWWYGETRAGGHYQSSYSLSPHMYLAFVDSYRPSQD